MRLPFWWIIWDCYEKRGGFMLKDEEKASKKIRRYIRDFGTGYYFRNSRREIAKINLASLKAASLGGLLLLLMFLFMYPYIVPGWEITFEYKIMIPVFVMFTAFSFIYDKLGYKNYYVIQGACILYYIVILANLIIISVFPYPDNPEYFISCFFVLIPIIFIVQPWIITTIVTAAAVAFLALAINFKSEACIYHDILSVLAGAVLSMCAMLMTFKLRISGFMSREKYKRLSRTDLMTGLLNKRSYEASCQRKMKERGGDVTGVLFVFDIDDFKIINDTFGHVAGDNVLEMIGKILRGIFREEDLIGRIGGDEFSIYINIKGPPDEIIREKAEAILTQVREKTRKAFKIEVTVSIGICATNNAEVEYREMYLNADRALYVVKQTTHDGWKQYTMK